MRTQGVGPSYPPSYLFPRPTPIACSELQSPPPSSSPWREQNARLLRNPPRVESHACRPGIGTADVCRPRARRDSRDAMEMGVRRPSRWVSSLRSTAMSTKFTNEQEASRWRYVVRTIKPEGRSAGISTALSQWPTGAPRRSHGLLFPTSRRHSSKDGHESSMFTLHKLVFTNIRHRCRGVLRPLPAKAGRNAWTGTRARPG
jgi:hypothetical protein